MLFTTTKVVILLSIIYQSWGADNLALNKPARQISLFEDTSGKAYTADKAVNGIFTDFSHTDDDNGNKWWTVDLQARYSIERIILYNRQDGFQDRLAKISILTSTAPSTDPSLPPGDWARKNYRNESYGSSGTVGFDPPIEARHVAIYSQNTNESLALAEVEVFGDYNYAFGKTASQSSIYGGQSRPDLAADKAVDGDISTTSITNFDQPNNAWWKVDLVDRILLREVTVYVRDGLCGPSNSKVDCSSRLSDVYLLTNPSDTNTDPNTVGNEGWRKCYHNVTALGEKFTQRCTEGTYPNPLTRLFSIRTNNGKSVELREVYVFGDDTNLPELSDDINVVARKITTSSITITFSQWNQQMTGGEPPTKYTVASSRGGSKTVAHNTNSQRLSKTFNGLNAGQTYTFTVSCITIQDAACTGPTHSVTESTLCTVPDAPGTISFTNSVEMHNNRNMSKHIATWVVPANANCNGTIQYQYNVTGQSPSILQTATTAIFYLDGDLPFEFVVRAKNSIGYSPTTSKNGRSGVLIPQFTAGQVTVTTKSSTCVIFTWESPAYPGGNITQYQQKCGAESWQTIQDGSQRRDLCDYQPNTNVTCGFRAKNSEGYGTAVGSSKTYCDFPEFTEELDHTDNYNSTTNKRYVSIISGFINSNCDNVQLQYSKDNSTYTAQSTFSGLAAVTSYNFTVKATNNIGNFSTKSITVVTGKLKPDDGPRITMNNTSQGCIVIEWDEPQTPNGIITGYRHTCSWQQDVSPGWNYTDENSLSYCGYDAGDVVTCDIQANTSVGFGPSATVTINVPCDKPSLPEFSFSTWKHENKTASLNITLQDSKSYCQYITEYTINVTHPNGSLVHNETTTTNGSYIINNLYGFTNYTVTIEVVNNEGYRSESTQYVVTVETLVPEEPGIQDKSTDEKCVSFTVSEPTKPNGAILNYTINCTGGTISKSTNSNQLESTLCEFPSATQVHCSVAAINSIGTGPPQNMSIYTQLRITNLDEAQLEEPDTSKISKDLIVPITINPIEVENVEVSTYIVMLSKVEARKKRSDTNPCPECYIAAEIPANEVTEGYVFNVGDGEEYNGHVNEPLVEQSVYELYLGIQAIVQGMDEPLFKYLDPIRIKVPEKKDNLSAGEIAGAVVGVVAFLALVAVAVFVVWRNRERRSEGEKVEEFDDVVVELPDMHSKKVTTTPAAAATAQPAVTKPAKNGSKPAVAPREIENVYDNSWGQSEAIPVDKLEWYIKTNTETIKTQYEEFKKLPTPNMSVALLEENKGKCRYKGLYPSDKHRVHLQRTSEEETDFINASFMKGYARDPQFIAAQGPFTDAVVEDFWLMIWQQRPSAVVMVTRAIENTKMKCKQYWPLEKGVVDTFGDFRVSLKASERYSDFSLNHLEVIKNGETRVIPHFNYLYWPDHGVPDIEVFVSFHRLISSTVNRNQKQPLLIHCSAGVGRTGTYIALDYLLEQAKREKKVDIVECVKQMRTRRPCMIQTVEQYVLLHQALYESLATENFSCMPPDLDSKFLMHSQHAGSSSDALSAEYKHAISRTASLNLKFTSGKLAENQGRNRYSEILAADSVMPYLMGGTKGSYINAVIVDGYKEKKQWIATQLPLSNTIADFWQLILEQDIKIIVQLEGGQKPFYPMKDGANMAIDQFVIKRTDSTTGDILKTVNLQLHTEDESRTVQVVVPNNWISETLPTTDIIISLQEAAEKMQQQTSTRNMCVTCLDGNSRCGLFICAYNAIEKLKAEQVVDLYYATVMAKLRRPQFIPTIEQYGYLYQVLKDYLNAFGEYANFR